MELLARYLSKFILVAIVSVILLSCATDVPKQISFSNADSVEVVSRKGLTYVNGILYSGILYTKYPHTSDAASWRAFDNGKEEGMHREFYSNRKRKSIRYFDHGTKEGLYEGWWENGKKRLEYSFEKNEYHGSCKEWTEQGVMIRNMHYRKGHEEGRQQIWDTNGKLLANYESRNGRNYGLTGVKGCATIWDKDSVRAH